MLVIVLLIIDFFVYKENGLTNEALVKLNCYCLNRDAVPNKEENDEENPEQGNIVKDSHDDDVISLKSLKKPEVDPDAGSTTSSSKDTIIEQTQTPAESTDSNTEENGDRIQSSKS